MTYVYLDKLCEKDIAFVLCYCFQKYLCIFGRNSIYKVCCFIKFIVKSIVICLGFVNCSICMIFMVIQFIAT